MVLDDVLGNRVHLDVLPPDKDAKSKHQRKHESNECKVPIGGAEDHCGIVREENGRLQDKQKPCTMDFPIPVLCCTCNRPLYGKWKAFLERVKAYRKQDGRPETGDLEYLTTTTKVTAEGRALNDLGLTFECCRVKLLSHPGI